MPVTLPPLSRRQFLAGSVAAGVGVCAVGSLSAAGRVELNRFALLADTHVSGQRDQVVRGANMFANLQKASGQILAGDRRPEAAFVNGDCAYLTGEQKDYAALVDLLKPLRAAGMPVHLAMGNHDHRGRFWQAVPPEEGQNRVVVNRHITIVESQFANWFVLDSLDVTNKTPGKLGQEQLKWLAEMLDMHADLPAIVMAHHNPDPRDKPSGLTDTLPLLKVLSPRKQVKAFFYGHTHAWTIVQHEGMHLVNLPPVAYVFAKGMPNGWVDARLGENGMRLELRCHDDKHPQQGQKVDLRWRV